MHRHKSNGRIVLDECLRAVAVVNVPIDDQHAIDPLALAGVVRADGDVAEDAEAHAAVAKRMVTRRPDGAGRSRLGLGSQVARVEYGTNGCARGIAGSLADKRVRIEAATTG